MKNFDIVRNCQCKCHIRRTERYANICQNRGTLFNCDMYHVSGHEPSINSYFCKNFATLVRPIIFIPLFDRRIIMIYERIAPLCIISQFADSVWKIGFLKITVWNSVVSGFDTMVIHYTAVWCLLRAKVQRECSSTAEIKKITRIFLIFNGSVAYVSRAIVKFFKLRLLEIL